MDRRGDRHEHWHQLDLKDGMILCELMSKLQPDSGKVNESSLNWPQLENIGKFIKAIQAYGIKPHDVFEVNDLFENGNMRFRLRWRP